MNVVMCMCMCMCVCLCTTCKMHSVQIECFSASVCTCTMRISMPNYLRSFRLFRTSSKMLPHFVRMSFQMLSRFSLASSFYLVRCDFFLRCGFLALCNGWACYFYAMSCMNCSAITGKRKHILNEIK